MMLSWTLLAAFAIHAVISLPTIADKKTILGRQNNVNEVTCHGKTFIYEQLAGYGLVTSTARDKSGDTLGGFSSIAFDKQSWNKHDNGSYTGVLWVLPDRAS